MSSLTLLSGATRVLKLTPNNNLITTSINSIDQLLDIALLADNKFTNWKNAASAAGKVGVVENNSSESDRYIDNNFNANTPEGTIWFTGNVAKNRAFYLQAGSAMNKSNSSTIFTDQDYIAAFDMSVGSGNVVDRCGNYTAACTGLNYQSTGKFNKCVKITGGSSKIWTDINDDVEGIANLSLTYLIKVDYTSFKYIANKDNSLALGITGFGDDIVLFFRVDAGAGGDFNVCTITDIDLSDFFLVNILYNGNGATDADKLRVFVNGEERAFTYNVPGLPAVVPARLNPMDYSSGNASDMNGYFNDARVALDKTDTDDELLWRYNNLFNQANYWTITVCTVILSIKCVGSNIFEIAGSGFKPETANPIVTINSVSPVIEQITDSFMRVHDLSIGLTGSKTITITNSDGETDTDSIIVINLSQSGIYNVSQHVDSGQSVAFIDDNGNPVNLSLIQLDTAGYVNIVGSGYDQSEAKRIKLGAGDWHNIPGIHEILYSGTETGLGIHVK